MVNGGTVDFWACVNFSRVRPDVANSFCHELVSMCCSKGMVLLHYSLKLMQLLIISLNKILTHPPFLFECCKVFDPQPLLPIQSANPRGIEKALFDIHSQSAEKLKNTGKHLQMLIVILPDVSGSYG